MNGAQQPFWRWMSPIVLTSVATTLLVQSAVWLGPVYGLGLFALVPLASGFLAAALCRVFGRTMRGDALATAALGQLLAGLGLILLRIEGMICLLMALPLALPLGLLGAWVGHLLLRRRRGVMAMAVLPVYLSGPVFDLVAKHRIPPARSSVTTELTVAAPPEVVWRNVIEFPALAEPREWYFRAGIAYPKRARIEGRGAGAVRYCQFSTGAFVEPIREWQEPSLLRFDVTRNPEPLRELSPYEIHPPHLRGWFRSTQGEFRLERLPGNRTRLIGTTWYTQSLQPAAYWTIWTDAIVHRIHRRVLEHIRTISETTASAP
ncbi:MAG: hypothetical protein NTY38_16260 [Acidobacteria bacterium]|nr:hypothetical protein [Acidobacteriota bacterium]